MATANDIILSSYAMLTIRASETSLQPDEIQDGLNTLNDMLAEWEPKYHLGVAPIMDVADEVRIPRFAESAVKGQLALRLGPLFGRAISIDLRDTATTSFNNMLTNTVFIGDVDYPSTLPRGSGNTCADDGLLNDRFFPQGEKRKF